MLFATAKLRLSRELRTGVDGNSPPACEILEIVLGQVLIARTQKRARNQSINLDREQKSAVQ